MTQLDIRRKGLSYFTEHVGHLAARSLDLLRDIETVIARLDTLRGQLEEDTAYAQAFNADLGAIPDEIDPDDVYHDGLAKVQDGLKELYDELISRREYARRDAELRAEDGVEDAYTATIAAAADLHNAINTLRWNIGEHDIDVAPRYGKVYESMGELIADLHQE